MKLFWMFFVKRNVLVKFAYKYQTTLNTFHEHKISEILLLTSGVFFL